jgi:hypothetical protein
MKTTMDLSDQDAREMGKIECGGIVPAVNNAAAPRSASRTSALVVAESAPIWVLDVWCFGWARPKTGVNPRITAGKLRVTQGNSR